MKTKTKKNFTNGTLLNLIYTGYKSLLLNNSESKEEFKKNCISYFIVPSKGKNEDGTYDTYGVAAIENDVIVDYILDISTDFHNVQSFVALCNSKKLSLAHLKNAVEDFMIA